MTHNFDAGYTGLSMRCNVLVLDEDGYADTCGLPRAHPVHGPGEHVRIGGGWRCSCGTPLSDCRGSTWRSHLELVSV